MSKVIDLNENINNYHYWSNSCGETHHWGEYDIAPDELPEELKRAFDELFCENDFGLNCYLTEYDGKYGISLEANYDSNYADDICVSYDEVIKTAMIKADLIATKFHQCMVLFGKDTWEWSDGSKESQLVIFMPWNISKKDYNKIGTVVGRVAY
jgi:hypothetical protein